MGRVRLLHPDFFLHEDLDRAEVDSGLPIMLAYEGLWTQADREGRFLWRPERLKAGILPFRAVDFSAILAVLLAHGWVRCYAVDGKLFGDIPSFKTWQRFHPREAASKLPAYTPAAEALARACLTYDGSEGEPRSSLGHAKDQPRTVLGEPDGPNRANPERLTVDEDKSQQVLGVTVDAGITEGSKANLGSAKDMPRTVQGVRHTEYGIRNTEKALKAVDPKVEEAELPTPAAAGLKRAKGPNRHRAPEPIEDLLPESLSSLRDINQANQSADLDSLNRRVDHGPSP